MCCKFCDVNKSAIMLSNEHDFLIVVTIGVILALIVGAIGKGGISSNKCPSCGRPVDNEYYGGMLCDDCSGNKYGQ